MDPMDYTMDDDAPAPNQGNSSASYPRHQCQNPSPPQGYGNFSLRRGYDPVHDSSSRWRTQAQNAPAPPTAPYAAPNGQPWPPVFVPGNNWQAFGSVGRPNFGDLHGRASAFGDLSRDVAAAETAASPPPELVSLAEHSAAARAYSHASAWDYGNRYSSYTGPYQANPGNTAGGSPASVLRPSLVPAGQETQQHPSVDTQAGPANATTPVPSASAVGERSLADIFAHVPNGMASNRHSLLRPIRGSLRDPPARFHGSEDMTGRRPYAYDTYSDSDSASDRENSEMFRLGISRHDREAMYAELDDERSVAALRGQLSASKRLPTKEALASLEILKPEDLAGEEKTCIICYNEFGVGNPEGLVEQPMRLPKCKHVFGDICIKKWFEDSDSCPYCRDKLPSQAVARRTHIEATMRAIHRERERQRQAVQSHQRARQAMVPHAGFFPEDFSPRRAYSFHRTQEEYEQLAHRQMETFASGHAAARLAQGEQPAERRRPGRGRLGIGRSSHVAGRSASTGLARPGGQSFNYQGPPRPFATATPPFHPGSERMVVPPVVAPGANDPNTPAPQTPRTRASHNPSPPSIASEEASPPVAFGSGPAAPPRYRFGVTTTASGADRRASDTNADEGLQATTSMPGRASSPVTRSEPNHEVDGRSSGPENPPEDANLRMPPLPRW